MEIAELQKMGKVKSLDDFLDTIEDADQRKFLRDMADQLGVRNNEQLESFFIMWFLNKKTVESRDVAEQAFIRAVQEKLDRGQEDLVDVAMGATEDMRSSLESLINNKKFEAEEVATGLSERTNALIQKFIDVFGNLAVFLTESESGIEKRLEIRAKSHEKAIDERAKGEMALAEEKVTELITSLAVKVLPPVMEKELHAHLNRAYANHKKNAAELMDVWNKKKAIRDFTVWFSATLLSGGVLIAAARVFLH